LPDESGQVQGRAEPRGRPGPRGRGPRERFPLRQGDEEKSFEFQGRRRTYIVHMPPGHDRSSAMPLVIVLHGGVVNAFFTAYNTGMNSTADREGFIAVYPNGTGRLEDRILTWNVGFGFGYALRNNVDDVGFLRELIERMVSEYGADPGRVYATGISNGGIMSYRLASEASDLVAAVAPVAGASAGRQRPGSPLVVFPAPARPVSTIAFHGMQDRFIPYGGGKGAGLTNAVYLPVQDSINLWVGYDGCAPTPDAWTSPSGNIIRHWYGGGREGSEVVLYTIRDGGHSWPGGVSPVGGAPGMSPDSTARGSRLQRRFANRIGATTREISANDLMWEFFQRHRRN
jgi:polyhydroxybutyrate depolymerase